MPGSNTLDGSAEAALAQIRERGYADPYRWAVHRLALVSR